MTFLYIFFKKMKKKKQSKISFSVLQNLPGNGKEIRHLNEVERGRNDV